MSVAYTLPQPYSQTEQDHAINALIARQIFHWSEQQMCEGTLQFCYAVSFLGYADSTSSWTCLTCGATGTHTDLDVPFTSWRHPRRVPDYVHDRSRVFDILQRIRQWDTARQQRFLVALCRELLAEFDARGELETIDMHFLTESWGFMLYIEPRPVCLAALDALGVMVKEPHLPHQTAARDEEVLYV